MSFIKNTEIKMHNVESTQFGVFHLELAKTEITEASQEINLMLDKSGSMDESCGDGNTKMKQITYVTNNILRFIANNCPNGNVSVSVKAFNSEVDTLIDKTVVTNENVNDLIANIGRIYPCDGTDIEKGLKAMYSESGLERHNIFMSDGDTNIGETDPILLSKFVDENAINTFVGFGLEHNPEMFASLSETKNSSYYFIDKIEKSGIAYGEILHGILYKCLSNVRIQITNGTIYDWKTNEWVSDIFVGNMSGEMKKTFHIMSVVKDEIQITVEGIFLNEPFRISYGFQGQIEDLQKMIYRQKTQEILFRAKHANVKREKQEIQKLKEEMKQFVSEMKDYMKETNDLLLKNLCDDIVIVYRTIGTIHGHMYSCSRQTSQGSERLHNVSDTPRTRYNLRPQYNLTAPRYNYLSLDEICQEEDNVFAIDTDLDEEMDEHIISDGLEDTPYYSGRVATVMRSVTEEDNAIEEDAN